MPDPILAAFWNILSLCHMCQNVSFREVGHVTPLSGDRYYNRFQPLEPQQFNLILLSFEAVPHYHNPQLLVNENWSYFKNEI